MENVRVSLLQRIINKFRYGLVMQVARNQLAKIGIEFTPYYWVQTGIGHTEMPVIEGISSDYSVDFLEEDDMITIVNNSSGYTEDEFLERLRAGLKCLGLKYRHNIVGFLWINLQECDFKSHRIVLENNEAYLTDMYTMETYRGKNLAPYLRCCSYEILRQMGREKIYSVVEYFNSSARKYMQKTNAKFIRLMLCVKLFGKINWSFTIKSY